MNEKINMGIIYFILIILMAALIFGFAGYTKGSIDTLSALNPTITQCTELLNNCQKEVLNCNKELWINERNEAKNE